MKFSAARDVLLKPLQAVIGVVERRQTMPILSNVLLVAKGNELAVTATDLEVELVAQTEVSVEAAGEITVSGRKLLDIVRALPDGSTIDISVSGEKAVIRSGRSKFSLATLPAAEFPSVEDIKAGQTVEVEQAPHRENAFLNGSAGCSLLPQWHAAGNGWEAPPCCRNRWPPARAL